MKYELYECESGAEALRVALEEIDALGHDVISVVPDHGGPLRARFGDGAQYGFLIVARKGAAT